MTTTLRLFSIEARRNAAIWFVPIIVAVSWWLLSSQYWTTILWDDTNRQLQQAVVPFAGPAIAGVAAWMAGRNRRRGTEDLLNSTACPATRRQIVLWSATAVWGLVAYALFAAYMMGQTALQATAGGPAFWPVATVTIAMLAHAAWGFLVGHLLPSRFTAPLVAIGALGLQQLAASHSISLGGGSSMPSWINQLAAHNGGSKWHALFYLGLAGAALAAMALRNRRSAIRIASFVVTTGSIIGSVVMIWGFYPRYEFTTLTAEDGAPYAVQSRTLPHNNFGQVISFPELTPPKPVCAGSPIIVCANPAYEPVLDDAIVWATTLIEPLLGLPGVPMRVEWEDTGFSGGPNAYIDVSRFADRLVADDTTLQEGAVVNEAQLTIRSWLQERAGMDHQNFFGCSSEFRWREGIPAEHLIGEPTEETCEATERFAALSAADQRAWLEEHYTDLRAGELTLEDLP